MASDIKIHEYAQLRLGDQELESAGAASAADFARVAHHYGPAVSIGEIPQGTSRARGRTPSTPRQLDSVGKHGLDAFRMRRSRAFREAKANRKHDGASWTGNARRRLLPPQPPPKTSGAKERKAAMATSPTSNRLMGSVAVGVIIVSGPGDLAFSSQEQTKVVAEVQNGLSWLGAQSHGGQVGFYYDIEHVTLTLPDDPNAPDSQKEAYWRDPTMVDLGYSSVIDYVNAIRTTLNTDWAYAAFFVKYSQSWFAYAYPGGPYLCMQYSNDNWGPDNIDRVFAHESGHIFRAPDEYAAANCNCTSKYGYFAQWNGNCVNCQGGGKDCIMNSSTWAMCHFTPWHLGFRWPNGNQINPANTTPTAPAACWFNNQLYVFWKANDSSNCIYFSASSNGTSWPDGSKINPANTTPAAPAACLFNNQLYVFWKANDSSNSIYYSASSDGLTWPRGSKINPANTTPQGPAACLFNNQLYVFWKANDSSNSIYYSASSNGTSWPGGSKINPANTTPQGPAVCVFDYAGDPNPYLFWKANDSSNSIYFSP